MIPVQQRISAAGGDSVLPGDCVKCCVASILELPYEDVPHFVAGEVKDADGNPLHWLKAINHWLRERGYPLYLRQWTNFLTGAELTALRDARGLKPGEPGPNNDQYRRRPVPDRCEGWWIASVISENFEDSTHAIVMHGDQVAFDPSICERRTPYEFIGGEQFIALDPARYKR